MGGRDRAPNNTPIFGQLAHEELVELGLEDAIGDELRHVVPTARYDEWYAAVAITTELQGISQERVRFFRVAERRLRRGGRLNVRDGVWVGARETNLALLADLLGGGHDDVYLVR